MIFQSNLASNVHGGHRIVTGNHDHPDSGLITLANSQRYRFADRIGQTNQPHQLKIKIMLNQGKCSVPNNGFGNTQHP